MQILRELAYKYRPNDIFRREAVDHVGEWWGSILPQLRWELVPAAVTPARNAGP